MTDLKQKIKNKGLRVGVLGLGYVGLPLVREFASAGLKVVGFDIDEKCIDIASKRGWKPIFCHTTIQHIHALKEIIRKGRPKTPQIERFQSELVMALVITHHASKSR